MNTPKHIAIIMDGNGRWAKKHFLARIKGHQKGLKTVREIVKYCASIKIEALTLFAFSSENKNRSKQETSLLFKLFLAALQQETNKLNQHNVQLKLIGDMSLFPTQIQKTAKQVETLLSKNTGLKLIIAANYGGQWDIIQATQKIAQLSAKGEIDPKKIDINTFSKYLSLADEPTVDLLIRTSGELRFSNFLLWDIAYSEFYFTDTLWPDFDTLEMQKAINNFNSRSRRFGGRKEQTSC